MARVSVGMPVYNAERWLAQAIEAILRQTFGDLEVLISDNASTDRSFEIAAAYAEKDARVRVYRNAFNVGVGGNYSLLVGYAQGEYFKWASSNDLCDSTFIEKCVQVLDAHPDVGLCYPKTKVFSEKPETGEEYEDRVQTLDEDPVVRFGRVLERSGLNNAINGLIRMSVLRQTGLIRPYYSADLILLGEIALRSKIVELPEFLFFRRFDRDSATRLQDAARVRLFHFPTARLGMFFQAWQRCWGYLLAISRADLTLHQRMRGFEQVAKLWYWAFPELYADLKEGVGAMLGRR